jgi:hypothetical protein
MPLISTTNIFPDRIKTIGIEAALSSLLLRQIIRYVVVITFIRHENMNPQLGVSGLIKRAHRNTDPIFFERVPKE